MAEEFFVEESFLGEEDYDQKDQDYFAEEYFIAPSEETPAEYADTILHTASFYGTINSDDMNFSKKEGYADWTQTRAIT